MPQVNSHEDGNIRVDPKITTILENLPAFKAATDGALIAAAQRKLLYLNGIRVNSRILAIAVLVGTRSLNDPELYAPVSTL